MENRALVSIVIPVYKVEKYLDECLTSCVNQTYRNLEIIVVNDGSPDSCGEITHKYMAQDDRIKEITQPNRGVAAARKVGIDFSTGDYIMQVDGDDFIADNCVELLTAAIEHQGCEMVYCDAFRWSDEGVRTDVVINPDNLKIESGNDYLESNITTFMWGKIYRRDVMQNLIAQSVNVSDDFFFNLQILPRCTKVSYLKEHLYYYRYNYLSIMNDKLDVIAAQYLIHSIERRQLFDKVSFTQKTKDILAYDNIRMIHQYLKYVRVDDNVRFFIKSSFKDYRFHIPRTIKMLRMELFLVISRLSPTLSRFLIKSKI